MIPSNLYKPSKIKLIFLVSFFYCLLISIAPVQAIIPPQVKTFPNIPYVMTDCHNKDWAQVHPDWGPVGGWWPFGEGQGHCSDGGSNPEAYILNAKKIKVTLEDGRVIPKPVGVGIPFTVDNVQEWANRLNKPEFDNLVFIVAHAPGLYGEVTSSSWCEPEGCDKSLPKGTPGSCSRCFDDVTRWASDIMPLVSKAFPNIPIFFQGTINSLTGLCAQAVTMPNKNIAVKANGWSTDLSIAVQTVNGVLTGGEMAFASVYYPQIIVGYEPGHGENINSFYWAVMEALSHHPDFFDIQEPMLNLLTDFKKVYGFPLWTFLTDHTQKSLENTPDVWVVLRTTQIAEVCWCGSSRSQCMRPDCCYTSSSGLRICTGPQRTNFSYWLYQKDDLPGGKTVAFTTKEGNAPEAAKQHAYGFFTTRRTDHTNGQNYMYFDVDDQYRPPVDKNGWEITATFINQGNDKLSLEYVDKFGQPVKKTIQKGQAIGQVDNWIDYKWTLLDADFSANKLGGADFKLNCEADGDEIVHRVIAKPVKIILTPTPTTRSPIPSGNPTYVIPSGMFFFKGWQKVELESNTILPLGCQIISNKEENVWENFISFLGNLSFAPKKKNVWVKCN